MASRYKRPVRPGRGGQSNAQGAGDSGAGRSFLNYYTGGLLGRDSGQANYDVNQPVSIDISGGGPQQFYSTQGEVVEQPYSDARTWWDRNIKRQPNQADILNRRVMGEIAEQKAAFPTEIEQQRALGTLANQQEIELLKQKQELEKPYQPVIGSTAPGDIDYRLPVDAAAITEGRDLTLPYLPVNPASVEGNLKAQEAASLAKFRTAQAEENLQPTFMNIGGALVRIPRGGSPEVIGQTIGGYDVEQPLVIDPKTGAFTGGNKRHIPQEFKMTPKPVGRINLTGGGQENLGPVYEQPASNAYFPFSGQINEFPIGETAVDGNPPQMSKSTGGSPTTQPQTRLTGVIPEAARATGSYLSGAAGAAADSLRLKEINELLLKMRKALIRREPVAPQP